jgi:hypothetical protein
MTDTKLTKSAGEYWVCSVLATLGWAAALTRDGLERTDVLAAHTETGQQISIQVKAASPASKNWRVNTKAQMPQRHGQEEWFVFVSLTEPGWSAPVGYVVPRDHAAAGAVIAWKNWKLPVVPPLRSRAGTGLEQARMTRTDLAGYKDRWDLLDRPTREVQVLLPTWMREAAGRLGLSPELDEAHPWHKQLPDWRMPTAT